MVAAVRGRMVAMSSIDLPHVSMDRKGRRAAVAIQGSKFREARAPP
jgi:hypothetical protein